MGHQKHKGLGGCQICVSVIVAMYLDEGKKNLDEKNTFLKPIFWCHTLRHGTDLRKMPHLEEWQWCPI